MDEFTNDDPGAKPKKRRQPRVEKDIFGNEYLGTKKVFCLNLDTDRLPDGAKRLISLASSLQMTVYDLAQVFSEALLMVDGAFWERKLEELTPFEWKLHEALKDEAFRRDVEACLDEHP